MKRYLSLILGVLLCSSCAKFLEEFSQDLAYAQDCHDLDEILIGNGYMTQPKGYEKSSVYGSGYFPYLQVMDDDVQIEIAGEGDGPYNEIKYYKNFYDWSNKLNINPDSGEEWEDTDWMNLYSHIGYLNVIIDHVRKYTSDSIEIRDRVEGEARFLRGAYYYLLVNLYANPYVHETASKDLGVPLNLTEDIEDKYYGRNTMAECYDVIVKDLQVAAEKLHGVKQATFYRVNEGAVRLLLSRVYLYMGEWQLALDECEKILALDNLTLVDLNSYGGEHQLLSSENSEILFTQGASATNTFGYGDDLYWCRKVVFVGSDELIKLYDRYSDQEIEDLRLNAYFQLLGDYYLVNKVSEYGRVYDIFVLRAAEVYLNKAEAEAMLDKTEAVSTIKDLLTKRFRDAEIPAIDGLQGEKLVKFIRDERRRELCFEAHRWFDLRRYAVSPKYPERKEIRHKAYDKNGVYEGVYTLKPYGEDPAWVLPIPGYEIVYNQGVLVDNPERIKRELE